MADIELINGANIVPVAQSSDHVMLLRGATPKRIETKNYLPYYDVRHYGAVGDDATDCRAAFIACRDAIYAAGGGVMFIPPGVYRLSDEIVFDQSIRIQGIQGTGNALDRPTDTPYYGPPQPVTVVKTAINKNGFVVKKVTADQSKPTFTIEGVHFECVAGINGYLTATTGSFIQLNDNNQWTLVRNCSFLGGYIQFESVGAFYYTIERSSFREPYYRCIRTGNNVRTDTGDWTIANNVFTPGFTQTPKMAIEWVSGGGAKIHGNKFDGSFTVIGGADYDPLAQFTHQVYVQNIDPTSDLIISHNSFENYAVSAIYANFSESLYHTHIVNNQFAPLHATGPTIEIVSGNDIIIDNYEINNWGEMVAQPAIKVTNANNVIIGKGIIRNYTTAFDLTGTTNLKYVFNGLNADEYLYGKIISANMPTYADEAAAIAGGLVTGTIYKTATGELRIKL